jgi:hypothetical protein
MNQPPQYPPGNNPYSASEFGTQPPVYQNNNQGDATGGLIPYKNPHALIAYYLGLFSLFPVLGLLLAIPAFVLGIIGLRNRNRNPAIKGSVHAWIGIVMGGFMTLIWGAATVMIIIGIVVSSQR